MITINANLSSIDALVIKLERYLVSFHQKALELYPNTGYEAFDFKSVECRRSLDFFVLTRALQEFNSGYKELESEVQYFEFRISQLERFLYKNADQNTESLMKAIADIHFKLIEKKNQKYICYNQAFDIDVPEEIVANLKTLGLLSDFKNIDTN